MDTAQTPLTDDSWTDLTAVWSAAEPPAVDGLPPIQMAARMLTFGSDDAWDKVWEADNRASLWEALRRLARRLLSAEEADELVPEAVKMAESIAQNAPLAVRTIKDLAYSSLDMSIAEISAKTYVAYDYILTTQDSKEGPRAFAEKRRPNWQLK